MPRFTEEYNKYFISRQFERLDLFELLKDKYAIKKALYLGSHIHITPSLVFPEVVYVDSYQKFKKMVESEEAINFINENKQYSAASKYGFVKANYNNELEIGNDFDLLISQYAGFVSQAGKQYLKKGGILVANNSHGDATMAHLDQEFELIAVANHTNDKWRISDKELEKYFVRKDGKKDSKTELLKSGKGPGYKKSAANYIFKIKS
jgi:hypothetical protein